MPAFYTHYRFGCDVLKQLPEDIRSICTAHRGLFDIGLHGPDIYFFYRPVLPNKVNRIGYAAHKRSGRYFLQRAQKVIASAHDKDAARAYFYGLLCHFTLDSICHPYIHTAMPVAASSTREKARGRGICRVCLDTPWKKE